MRKDYWNDYWWKSANPFWAKGHQSHDLTPKSYEPTKNNYTPPAEDTPSTTSSSVTDFSTHSSYSDSGRSYSLSLSGRIREFIFPPGIKGKFRSLILLTLFGPLALGLVGAAIDHDNTVRPDLADCSYLGKAFHLAGGIYKFEWRATKAIARFSWNAVGSAVTAIISSNNSDNDKQNTQEISLDYAELYNNVLPLSVYSTTPKDLIIPIQLKRETLLAGTKMAFLEGTNEYAKAE